MELRPRLRDGKKLTEHELYPINIFPEEIVYNIAGYLLYLIYIGREDISGDDWGDAFADAIDGKHLERPLGIADVIHGKSCWSMKTVKDKHPFNVKSVRLISGRCSPDYSYGITDPHEDIQKTGTAVLGIWNERVNIATDEFSQVRTGILIRSYDLSEYVLFEENMDRYRTNEFHWKENRNGNLIGYDENEQARFTWQPHGSQFTIHTPVPNEAVRFKLKLPDHIITKQEALDTLKYDKSWVTIL